MCDIISDILLSLMFARHLQECVSIDGQPIQNGQLAKHIVAFGGLAPADE